MQQMPVFYPRGYFPATTNAERQRDFRKRNPDYYRLLHAKRRAAVKAYGEKRREAERLAAEEALASQQTSVDQEVTVAQESVATAPMPAITPANPIASAPMEPMPTTPEPVEPLLTLPAPADDDWNADLKALIALHKLRAEAEALIGSRR